MTDLDHNASTPLDPRVRAAMVQQLQDPAQGGNPSSLHRRGQAARAVVETARRRVAAAVGADPLGVTFTSGGTEADNLAIFGVTRALCAAGRPHGVLTSPLEHPAVLAAAERLGSDGVAVVWLPIDKTTGQIDPQAVADAVERHPEVGVLSVAAANHELGTAYDIPAVATAARQANPGLWIHVDAVQAFGKCPVDLRAWPVDLLSLSSHKIYGPAGIGALVHRKTAAIQPLLAGGEQERGRRPGTPSGLLIHGFGVAAELAAAEQAARRAHCERLQARLRQGVQALGGRIVGDPRQHTGNTVNVGFEGCEGELLAMNLDLEGFCVSTGAACSAGSPEPSAVLRALGQSATQAAEAIRISVGHDNTEAEIEAFLAVLPDMLDRIRRAGSPGSVQAPAHRQQGTL